MIQISVVNIEYKANILKRPFDLNSALLKILNQLQFKKMT